MLGRVACALPILISISALGAANATVFTSARYCMVGAQCGYLPKIFSFIQKRRLTPLPSIFLQVSSLYSKLISRIFCLSGNSIYYILYTG